MRNTIQYLIPLMLLSGCAVAPYIPPPSTTHYQQELSVWIGQNVKDPAKAWGQEGVSEIMTDGSQRVTWSNRPRWACSTIAVANSSGTILSWDFQGGSCVADYSSDEVQKIQEQFVALQRLAPHLKRKTHLHLTFYENAVDTASHRADSELDCYFIRYSRFYLELTVRPTPTPKSGFNLSQDLSTYELKYISNIEILPDN